MSFFVDTNVVVYARDASEVVKQPKAAAWLAWLWETGRGRLSTQVVNEVYVVLTRKLDPGMSTTDARADLDDLAAWRPWPLHAELTSQAWAIEDRFGLSFWDALIVAAAKASSCRYLLTEDLHDGQDLDGILVVDPFVHEPQGFVGGS